MLWGCGRQSVYGPDFVCANICCVNCVGGCLNICREREHEEKNTNTQEKMLSARLEWVQLCLHAWWYTEWLTVFFPLQAQRWGDPHQDPELGRLLRPVRGREVCHAGWAGAVLHRTTGSAAREERTCHRAQVPTQLQGPHVREVLTHSLAAAHAAPKRKAQYVAAFVWIHKNYTQLQKQLFFTLTASGVSACKASFLQEKQWNHPRNVIKAALGAVAASCYGLNAVCEAVSPLHRTILNTCDVNF